jgi:hypothetical protein
MIEYNFSSKSKIWRIKSEQTFNVHKGTKLGLKRTEYKDAKLPHGQPHRHGSTKQANIMKRSMPQLCVLH